MNVKNKNFAVWSDNLSVDIDLIDDQHKVLIQLINDSSQMILDQDFDKGREVLRELHKYTDTHFSEEEELFRRSSYPHVDKHLKEHIFFIKKLDDFEQNISNNDISVSLNILEFLKNWLFYHIEIIDKGYSLYVKKVLQDN